MVMVMVMRMIMAVVVTAMRVMHMIMPMRMIVPVMMTMIVVMSVIVAMILTMIVTMGRLRRIGAAFRLEWRIDRRDLGAERRQQGFDRGRALHADAVRQQLNGDMAVAEVPGEPRQRGHIGGARLDQRLRRRHHFDACAIVKQQQIVGAQPHRAMQVNVDRRALDAGHGRLPGAALRIVKDHGIDHRPLVALVGGNDAGGARHDGNAIHERLKEIS